MYSNIGHSFHETVPLMVFVFMCVCGVRQVYVCVWCTVCGVYFCVCRGVCVCVSVHGCVCVYVCGVCMCVRLWCGASWWCVFLQGQVWVCVCMRMCV